MDLQLAGKPAIVTGGSRGIGKAIARALAEEGVHVVIAARTLAPLHNAAAELAKATGRQVYGIAADTGNDASVNAATPGGAAPAARLAELTGEGLLDDVNVKAAGYLRTAQAVAPHLVAAGLGWQAPGPPSPNTGLTGYGATRGRIRCTIRSGGNTMRWAITISMERYRGVTHVC